MSVSSDPVDNQDQEEIDVIVERASYVHIGDLHLYNFQTTVENQTERCESVEVNRIGEELKLMLRNQTNVISGTIHSPVEMIQPLTPVTLPMASAPQRMDDDLNSEGHFHRRDDMRKKYDPHPGNIIAEQLFSWSKSRATMESRALRDEAAANNFVNRNGNMVGIVGQAGIGKTTAAKQWAKSALQENLFDEISYLFFIAPRFLNFNVEMTFLQFLVSTVLPNWNCPPEYCESLLDNISRDQHVLIIVDGLDESAFESFSAVVHQASLHGRDTAEAYMKNLLAGNLLPFSRKIFTSRPAQLFNLNPIYRPHFIVQILGLDKALQQNLGRQICGGQYESVQRVLDSNASLFAYCFVPINFILTVNYILNFGTEKSFISISRVLSFACEKFCHTDHVDPVHCDIKRLAALAWEGVMRNMIVFSNEQLERFELSQSTQHAFLNTCVKPQANLRSSVMKRDRVSFFSHLIWQEKFAADHLMFVTPAAEFCALIPQLLRHRRDVVVMFLFGLFDPITYNQMSVMFGPAATEDRNAKLDCLKHTVARVLQGSGEPTNQSDQLLRCCSWLHEANNDELTSFAAQLLPFEVRHFGSILPVDMANLVYVLKALHRPLSINLTRCRLKENALEIFVTTFATETMIENLDLSYVAFSTEDCVLLAICLGNIRNLNVRDCELRPNELAIITERLPRLQHKMHYVNLSENKLRIRGARIFSACIKNIENLDLTKCLLVAEGTRAIASEIDKLKEPMESLCVDENSIGDEGAVALAHCVRNIRSLSACNCAIEAPGVNQLCTKIADVPQQMTSLRLSNNKIGDDGARSICHVFSKLHEIDLAYCHISNTGAKKIANALTRLTTPLKCLDLSDNNISDEGVTLLVRSSHMVQKLIVKGCTISDACKEDLQFYLLRNTLPGHTVEF